VCVCVCVRACLRAWYRSPNQGRQGCDVWLFGFVLLEKNLPCCHFVTGSAWTALGLIPASTARSQCVVNYWRCQTFQMCRKTVRGNKRWKVTCSLPMSWQDSHRITSLCKYTPLSVCRECHYMKVSQQHVLLQLIFWKVSESLWSNSTSIHRVAHDSFYIRSTVILPGSETCANSRRLCYRLCFTCLYPYTVVGCGRINDAYHP
jgi:hypothetical protein